MAYVDTGDVADGGTIETTWGDQVRANFQAGVPDIFAAEGDLAIATGADAAAALTAGAQGSVLVMGAARPEWNLQPAAHVYRTTDQTIGASWVSVAFDAERYDTNEMWIIGAASRLTVPANGGGIYHIGGNVEFADPAAGTQGVQVRILLGGSTTIAQSGKQYRTSGDGAVVMNINCDYALVATNYVELQVYADAALDIIAVGNYSPEFWIHWVRPTPP